MKNNRKVLYGLVALALVLSVVGISVGFAAMSSTLTINGTAQVAPATWKIKFTNLKQDSITGDAEVTTAPQITSDTHIGNYAVKLTKPGDSVVYTFDVENEGTLDAQLDTYTFAEPTIAGTGDAATADATIVKNNLVYTLTYDDDSTISTGATLAKDGGKASFKLTVSYPETATELPAATVNVTGMDITFVYGQK